MKLDSPKDLGEIDVRESASISEELEADLESQHRRDDKIVLHRIKKYSLIAFAIVAGITVVVYLWHVFMPEGARWLSDQEVGEIRSFALSICTGVGAALVGNYFFHR